MKYFSHTYKKYTVVYLIFCVFCKCLLFSLFTIKYKTPRIQRYAHLKLNIFILCKGTKILISFGYMFRYVIICSGNCNGWGIRNFPCVACLLISLGLSVFLCYKRGMAKVIYKVIFTSSTWGNNPKQPDGNSELR